MNDPWNEGRSSPLNDAPQAPSEALSNEALSPEQADEPVSPLPRASEQAALQDTPEQGVFAALGRNLAAGYRLVMGRALNADAVACTLGQIVALLLLLLLVNAGFSFVTTEAPVQFDAYGLNYLGATSLFSLLVLMLASRMAGGNTARFVPLLTAFLAASVLISLLSQLLWLSVDSFDVSALTAWSLLAGLLLWQVLVVMRLLHIFIGAPAQRALLLGGLYGLMLLASLWIFPRTPLWYTDTPQESAQVRYAPLDVESIFYAQHQLMRNSLAQLEAQRPGVTDLYLMAVGGYGLEDVFLKEVEFVREQFDRQYATRGRSLILANNPATVDKYPLANRHNLALGLDSVAQKMDTEEDVLFLFMTSHGSRDHRFSLEFGAVELNDLTPEQLRQALDDAGIRWRVILVSSCFSGGFIDALQSPETLVITAAAADRTSFGCGVDSDFTYFGTAYFKQALQQQPRFIQAFDIANQWVSEREAREQIGASQPQLSVGESIAGKLSELYREPGIQAAFAGSDAARDQCPELTCTR
ncbi:C13 family peptidase [Marinobacterium rhizophilum]|uniref:C13 family peptidase n=1 Tax=Marinobacterium rhizophilum TaxID=420402 RepID=UPI00037D6C4F|nr:C13 family peptidase [Marinobacterium rhizophilum]